MIKPKLEELKTIISCARQLHKRPSTIKKLVDDGLVQAWGNSRRLLVHPKAVEQAILDTTVYVPPKFKEKSRGRTPNRQPARARPGKVHRLVKI